MRKILGLDASTSTTGWAVLEYDEKTIRLVEAHYYKPPKKGNVFERLVEVQNFIHALCLQWKPHNVVLEDFLLFMQGKSSARTITALSVLNRVVGLAVLQITCKPPELLFPISVRSAIKITHRPSKEEVPEVVAQHLGMEFPYLYNKKGKLRPENYDMADAMAVAVAFILKNNRPVKKKKS